MWGKILLTSVIRDLMINKSNGEVKRMKNRSASLSVVSVPENVGVSLIILILRSGHTGGLMT